MVTKTQYTVDKLTSLSRLDLGHNAKSIKKVVGMAIEEIRSLDESNSRLREEFSLVERMLTGYPYDMRDLLTAYIIGEFAASFCQAKVLTYVELLDMLNAADSRFRCHTTNDIQEMVRKLVASHRALFREMEKLRVP